MKHFAEPQRGLWHLMSAPEEQLPGTLRTEADGQLVLEINGVLGAASDDMPSGQHRLVGRLDSLESVCLEGCFVTRGPHPFTRAPVQTWHVGEALVGAEFAPDKPLTVRGAEFEIVGLTKWSRWKAFDPNRIGTTQEPASLTLWTDDGITVDLIQRVRHKAVSETVSRLESPMHLRVQAASSLTQVDLRDVAIRLVPVLPVAMRGDEILAEKTGGRNQDARRIDADEVLAARTTGIRFVQNVLAVHASRKVTGPRTAAKARV